MGRDRAISAAATAMSFVIALATILFGDLAQDTPPLVKLAAAIIGVVGVYGVFTLFFKWFAKRRHRVLTDGVWYYQTFASRKNRFRDANFGLMKFSRTDDDELRYEVSLYPSLEAMASRSRRIGWAESRMVHYNTEQKRVHVVFEVRFASDDPANRQREGVLSMKFTDSGDLDGEWYSAAHLHTAGELTPTLSSGLIFASRSMAALETPNLSKGQA